jgi:hypothetical protein
MLLGGAPPIFFHFYHNFADASKKSPAAKLYGAQWRE